MSEPIDDGFTAAYKQTRAFGRRGAARWRAKPGWLRWGGALLIVSALLSAIELCTFLWFWSNEALWAIAQSEQLSWLTDLTVVAGVLLLVFAPGSPRGIAGGRRLAKASAIVFAVAKVVSAATISFLNWWFFVGPGAESDPGAGFSLTIVEYSPGALDLVEGIALIVIAYLVASQRVLRGVAQWALLVYVGFAVIIEVVDSVVRSVIEADLARGSLDAYNLASSDIWIILPMISDLLLAVTGALYLTGSLRAPQVAAEELADVDAGADVAAGPAAAGPDADATSAR